MIIERRITLGLVLLVTGAGLYLLYRPTSLLFFSWISSLGLASVASSIRLLVADEGNPDPWIIYCLPNGLWIASFGFFISAIWCGISRLAASFWICLLATVGLLAELLQKLTYIPGTFDIGDVLAYLSGTAVALVATAPTHPRRPALQNRTG